MASEINASDIDFETFLSYMASRSKRRSLLMRDGRPYHVLISQQFDKAELNALCDTATGIRRLDRHVEGRDFLRQILAGKRVMNLFAQPSTRTAESFAAAAEKLGATVRVVSDLRTSSFAKGESVDDSVRTLSSFFDTIVARHHDDTFAARAAWALSRSQRPIPVISAGSGKDQHVTQSLLDIYTLRYSFAERGGIDGKRVMLVGDIGRNRAARSLIYLLTKYEIARVDIVCSKEHMPDDDLIPYVRGHGIQVELHPALGPALAELGGDIDALYMTRLQQEWDKSKTELGTSPEFVLDWSYRDRIRDNCVIMHPLPRVNELPEQWDQHPGFVVWRQVRNGMWMRSAVLATIHGADSEIRARATRLGLL